KLFLFAKCQNNERMNDLQTEWFPIPTGVKQGDVLSPNLFSLFINDLALEIKQLDTGVHTDSVAAGVLLYADDVAHLTETEEDLQSVLNILQQWCCRWRPVINQAKTQIVTMPVFSCPPVLSPPPLPICLELGGVPDSSRTHLECISAPGVSACSY
uniref:Reverse transcriptase domain-containing protein n=1 Tax=Periophthalmus magnuspinnatus TaxID=409849 RepID=A0A3B4AI39_9GOBI